jgi:ABC-type iron transport system FetAB permease component
MLLGNAISAIGVAMNTVQKEFADNRDKVETYLAMGASRFEACKPIACEALKLALLPTVNQMSIIGLISIPGMMTGAIVGGKSVEQAARLQSTYSCGYVVSVVISDC